MTGKRNREAASGSGGQIRFSVLGLVCFSVALMLATVLSTVGLSTRFDIHSAAKAPKLAGVLDNEIIPPVAPRLTPPWGELIVHDIQLECPDEYVAYEADTNNIGRACWSFARQSREEVSALLQKCGFDTNQLQHALSPAVFSLAPTNTAIHPDDDLVFSLSPETRERLYLALARDPVNYYTCWPYRLSQKDFEDWSHERKLSPVAVQEIRKLSYERNGLLLFSDYPTVLNRLKNEQERLALAEVLSRSPACLVRLCIRPDTDVDKLLAYWGRGALAKEVKEVRPLLRSLQCLSRGGTLSLLYLLPALARERLNTFPMPSKPGNPIINCHWTALNFFAEMPEPSLADPANVETVLNTRYYKIAKPSLYGDVVIIRNARNKILHSAIHLADDLIYTKNGETELQPWVITRLQNIINEYTYNYPPKVEFYRDKCF
jgi:hypothetical protein